MVERSQIDIDLEELETRMDRLRALYEQYFMGIERVEPHVPRKDVDRRVADLRKARFQNTAKRFKFQTLVQKYNTMQQHWNKTCREIEEGKYRRHRLKAERRFGTLDPNELARQGRGATAPKRPEVASPTEEDTIEPARRATNAAEREIGALLDEGGGAPAAAAAPAAGGSLLGRLGATTPTTNPLTAGATKLTLPKLPPGAATMGAAPAPTAPASPPAASPTATPATPARTASPSDTKDPPGPPPRRVVDTSPGAVTPKRISAIPPAPNATATPPARPGPPPVPRPPASPAATPAERPITPPARPAASGANLSEDRIATLHRAYVDARLQTNATSVSLEKLSRSIRETEEKLRATHRGKNVDFEVVVKDGKAILKPKIG